jgi:hypothetical protein
MSSVPLPGMKSPGYIKGHPLGLFSLTGRQPDSPVIYYNALWVRRVT